MAVLVVTQLVGDDKGQAFLGLQHFQERRGEPDTAPGHGNGIGSVDFKEKELIVELA